MKQKNKLTLDRPVTYQICVPGILKETWLHINDEISVTIEKDVDGLPVTMLIATLDQAALQGLLRHLFNLGLPLISVNLTQSNDKK